ncbi:MAG TPA: protein translocase subunit SecD [Gemmataceae bacterium]|nr:protein translocase subunit SecD [Gemmataceae bacterium]
MKSFLGRILICAVPVVLGIAVCAWAYHGGKFRLGVDLVGGTILVYEVDISKQQGQEVKSDELATALKRRIDPADLLNVTIRPVAGETPRVEIILPTGGQGQQAEEMLAWSSLLQEVEGKYPLPEDQPNLYKSVPFGMKQLLVQHISEAHKDADPKAITAFIDSHYHVATGRRALTSEEVENIKNLIQQQGRLEFRILANPTDDKDALKAAEDYLRNEDNKRQLERLEALGEPPPPPRNEAGGLTFHITLAGEEKEYGYQWVELGKEELYSLHLNNAAGESPATKPMWDMVAAVRDKEAIRFPPQGGSQFLLYSRTISNPGRLTPKDRQLGKKYEYFILTRKSEPGKEVTGDYLSQAVAGASDRGEPAVHFGFNSEGANLFYDLTSLNKPSRAQGSFERKLAIILDGQIRTAPGLKSAIRDRGQISGGFTQKSVQEVVTILRAGALPATLKPNPVSENSMGPTLGSDTIRKGTLSVGLAFLAVLIFMLFYYRFAGVVACVALLANLVLTVAFMVLVNATFTLPGLAGLVLMLGMAVDANVLIYERLREERERGASLALAIRNGYDRAFPTIIDTHLSSIFTAIVLYVVGNDQLKGFGISLTMGLIISLFTSLYMTRTMFDLWQSKGWLHKLSFYQGLVRVLHRHHWDFMGIRYYWFTATIILTVLGAGLFLWRLNPDERGRSVMNIDFIGGTAYTGRLATPLTITELREKLENNVPVPGLSSQESDLPDISIEQIYLQTDTGGRSSLFTVRTAEKDAAKVQKIVNTRLGDALAYIELHKYAIGKENKSATLEFTKPRSDDPDFASRAQLTMLLREEGLNNFRVEPLGEEQNGRFSKMKIELSDAISRAKFDDILQKTKVAFDTSPQPERLENFDAQLAKNTQERALYAILASWAAILLYLWFRFGNWTFGAAAVLCLLHDLFFTLGVIAAAHYLHGTAVGNLLGVSDFKIDLPAIAALLTLVGYSVNDTIVVFDRIREVRGKNPILTPAMINDSVNQTLTRTILASMTVWLVVIVLYAFGGEGVHLFAFVMIVGVIVGTYSSIYIASPLLLIFGEGTPSARERQRQELLAAAERA